MNSPRKRRNPTVISLFTGAGGFDYGLEAAGFGMTVAVEIDPDACNTIRCNRRWPLIERSILKTPTDEILDVAGLKKGQADLLVGGPPCQPFSKSSYWTRGDTLRLDDPRSRTLGAFLRVAEEALPRVILLENVAGFSFNNKDEALQLILRTIARINKRTGSCYSPVFQVLNAADYGVPQLRKRFILVAARDGTDFQFPPHSHAKVVVSNASYVPYTTAWDALSDVIPEPNESLSLRGKWARLLPSIPEGHNYLWHTDRGGGKPLFGWRTRYWTFLLKLAKNHPAWTVQASPGPASGPFHWDNRRLSIRELCRLQTFPDNINLFGCDLSQRRQVGNAVPCLLAEVLGRAIRTQLLGFPTYWRPLSLAIRSRRSTPPSAKVEPVPDDLMDRSGYYEPHPGPGKGPGALRRRLEQQLNTHDVPLLDTEIA